MQNRLARRERLCLPSPVGTRLPMPSAAGGSFPEREPDEHRETTGREQAGVTVKGGRGCRASPVETPASAGPSRASGAFAWVAMYALPLSSRQFSLYPWMNTSSFFTLSFPGEERKNICNTQLVFLYSRCKYM